jgi:cholesterol transport system auxiliary component
LRVWLIVLAGCALTSRSTPVELRYFVPPIHAATAVAGEGPLLRLGRVTPTTLLRERILHRDTEVELGRYETLRWTDRPEAYVRRALERALFDSHRFAQAVGGDAPTLDVDVLAFEEVRRGARRFGRVVLAYDLRDEQRVLAHGTVAIEREAAPNIDAVVAAIGDALDAATAELARRLRQPL